jgi:hypothetical protein
VSTKCNPEDYQMFHFISSPIMAKENSGKQKRLYGHPAIISPSCRDIGHLQLSSQLHAIFFWIQLPSGCPGPLQCIWKQQFVAEQSNPPPGQQWHGRHILKRLSSLMPITFEDCMGMDSRGDAGSHRSCLTCTLSLFCERKLQILQDGSKLTNKILGKNNFQAK